MNFDTDKIGGIAKPDYKITSLSNKLGPVGGDIKNAIGNNFNPATFFDIGKAKLLGAIDLKDIVSDMPFIEVPAQGTIKYNAPKLTTNVIYDNVTKLPKEFKTEFVWEVESSKFKDVGPFKKTKNTHLNIRSTLIKSRNSTSSTIEGNLTNFRLDILDVLIVTFNKVYFASKDGEKLTLEPKIREVTIGKDLSFLKKLLEYMKTEDGTGFSVEVKPSGAKASFSLGIPTVGAGALTIQNIALSSSLVIPFDGTPCSLGFAFSTREKPFIVTVYGLGGGGFFGLDLNLDGIKLLEGSIEFGASVALNLGIAKGEAHIFAGIYYKMESKVNLSGYIRMGGNLEILGLINVSVEFLMQLSYKPSENPPCMEGEASMTVCVEILFFSKTVTLTVRRRINFSEMGFADRPPRRILFKDLMTQDEWNQYCEAFA
jgi:hypothetical protein